MKIYVGHYYPNIVQFYKINKYRWLSAQISSKYVILQERKFCVCAMSIWESPISTASCVTYFAAIFKKFTQCRQFDENLKN